MFRIITSGIMLLWLCSCDCIVGISANASKSTKTVTLKEEAVVKDIQVASFNKIVSKIPATIIFSNGEQKLTAAMPADAFDYVDFYVDSEILYIESSGFNLKGLGKAVLTISLPELTSMSINSSGKFLADNGIKSSTLAFNINGSGDIHVNDIETKNLSVKINGSGDIDLERVYSDVFNIKINGSGNIDASEVDILSLGVKISGSGSLSVGGKAEDVDVKINGSGDVDLRSLELNHINSSVSGSGRVYMK